MSAGVRTAVYEWEGREDDWDDYGYVWDDGSVSGDVSTTPEQAMEIMATLALIHNLTLHVGDGENEIVVNDGKRAAGGAN